MRLVSSEEPGPDLEKIKSVARGGDFGPPMHFVGREEAIEGILDACRKVRAGSCYRRTLLVTGGSGAGCTSLLVEIRRRLEEDDSNDAPRVGFIPSHGFSRPEEAIGNILNKLEPPMPGKRWSVPSGVPFQQAAGPLSQQARDSMSVLLVDNADRVTGDSTNAAGWPISSLLRELHDGRHGLRLLLVLAGKYDTRARLQGLGLRRLRDNSVHLLGALSQAHCMEAAERMFRELRLAGDPEQDRTWREAIVEDSQCWPLHLHYGLKAACGELLQSKGNLNAASLKKARQLAARWRESHYRGRRSGLNNLIGPFPFWDELFPVALRALGPANDCARETIEKAVGQWLAAHAANRRVRSHNGRPMGAENAIEIVARLIEKGILQEGSRGRFSCPIPGLRRYAERERRQLKRDR